MRSRTLLTAVASLLVTLVAGLSAAAVMGVVKGSHERPQSSAGVHPGALVGLWSRFPEARAEGDLLRFYFFHPSGIGLYRYGKVGLNTTQSFDWRVEGKELVLRFRKSGEEKRSAYAVVDDARARALSLAHDPKEPLAENVRYSFIPPPQQVELAGDLFEPAGTNRASETSIAGHMWIEQQRFATGGLGFSLYQLKDAAIDGRGVGWHHQGDYDDWSTESLSYRSSASELELWFGVRGEHARTPMKKEARADGKAVLTLVNDPRGFWHVHAYQDAGPSFGSAWLATPAF